MGEEATMGEEAEERQSVESGGRTRMGGEAPMGEEAEETGDLMAEAATERVA